MIDGLMRNDVIKSDIHSTDTHGYSEVIFGATFGLVEYAPRIKGLGHQQLYAFQKRKHYEEPARAVECPGVGISRVAENDRRSFATLAATLALFHPRAGKRILEFSRYFSSVATARPRALPRD